MKNERFKSFTQIGTPECGALCAVCAVVLVILIMLLGFWRTLLVAVIGALGAFIGGVKDKRSFVTRILDGILPGRKDKPYSDFDPKLRKAVRDAIHRYDEEKTEQVNETAEPAEQEAPAEKDE